MNGVLVKLVGGVMALGLVGGGGTVAAVQNADVAQVITQDEPPTPGDRPVEGRRGSRGAALVRHLQGQMVDLTGMTGCEIMEARASGESFASILEAAGVDPDEVAEMALETLAEKLEQAVAEGRITQAQAGRVLGLDARLERSRFVENNPWLRYLLG